MFIKTTDPIVTVGRLSVEAYEQYGSHSEVDIYTTCDWARREERLDYERALWSFMHPLTAADIRLAPGVGELITKRER